MHAMKGLGDHSKETGSISTGLPTGQKPENFILMKKRLSLLLLPHTDGLLFGITKGS